MGATTQGRQCFRACLLPSSYCYSVQHTVTGSLGVAFPVSVLGTHTGGPAVGLALAILTANTGPFAETGQQVAVLWHVSAPALQVELL